MNKNIEKAYLAEQEYLKTDRQGRQLVDILSELDYTLDKYFNDKKEYLLRKNKTYIELLDNKSLDDIFDKVTGSMNRCEQACYLSFNNDLFAWTGTDDFDENKAKEYGMQVHKMDYIGGTMIIDKADLSGAISVSSKLDINFDYFANKFLEFLKSKGEQNVILDNNDILVDGKKVFGGASYRTDDMYVFLFVATFSDNLNIVKEFCPLNKDKMPGFITKTNSNEMVEEVLSWLKAI